MPYYHTNTARNMNFLQTCIQPKFINIEIAQLLYKSYGDIKLGVGILVDVARGVEFCRMKQIGFIELFRYIHLICISELNFNYFVSYRKKVDFFSFFPTYLSVFL